jgi:N-acetylglutamate synthase-like GNAT family acetyltransferase
MKIAIRPAKIEDADVLTKIALISKRSVGYDDAFMAACEAELSVTPAQLQTHEYWVALGDTPCGFVGLEVDADGTTGKITSLFIHPDWQRRGVGGMLWETVERSAREKGLMTLRLDSDPDAEPFYQSLGFTTVSRAPSGSIPGRTLPHMQIEL